MHSVFSPPHPSPPPPPHMSSSLSRPPYSWFLSVSLFSCRLLPFSNKANPVIEQRITFPKPVLHLFTSFLKVLEWARDVGNSFFSRFYCTSPMFFPSGHSFGTILSAASPSFLSNALPSLLFQDCLSMNHLFPTQELSGLGNLYHSKSGADRELHKSGRDGRNKVLWEGVWTWVKMTWAARFLPGCRNGNEFFGTKCYDRWKDLQRLIYISPSPTPGKERMLVYC